MHLTNRIKRQWEFTVMSWQYVGWRQFFSGYLGAWKNYNDTVEQAHALDYVVPIVDKKKKSRWVRRRELKAIKKSSRKQLRRIQDDIR